MTPEETTPVLPSWVAAACTRCGKCCLDEHYMMTLPATKEDVKRWKRERRDDILQYVAPVGPEKLGLYDLWVKDGRELSRCPFVRKDRGKSTYHCTIYETRPAACRGYPVKVSQMIGLGCEIIDEIKRLGIEIGGIEKQQEGNER